MRFQYWQPTPRWRPLPIAGKSGQPRHGHQHHTGETQAPITLIRSVEKGGREGKP